MLASAQKTRVAQFGIDAPAVPVALSAGIVLPAGLAALLPPNKRRWRVGGHVLAGINTLMLLNYLHGTLRGKFQIWDAQFQRLALRGDEVVVDLGCGRGAVLLAAAARLHGGRAIGVDLWRSADQSGNHPEITRANAAARGLADRVELHTADLRELPLPDQCADVALTSLAIHNLPDPPSRDAAIREAARVLRPSGRLVIFDLAHVARYAEILAGLGLSEIEYHNAGWRYGWLGRVLTATKPASPSAPPASPPDQQQ